MPLISLAYRAVKQVVRRVPPGVLRFRPYTVHAIPIERFADNVATSEGPANETIRWVCSSEEAESLGGLATEESRANWDGAARRAAVVLWGEEPIACVWVARGDYTEPDLGVRYALADGDLWLHAAVVAPDRRGGGVYTRLLRCVGRWATAEGSRRVLFGVSSGNAASHAAHARWRPERIGGVFATRSLGATFCLTSGRVERVGSLRIAAKRPLTLRIG